MNNLIPIIKNKQTRILDWLESKEKAIELPLYSSVDIREAGFKMAVVDTNLFPAGFNNLCEHGIEDAIHFMREAILQRVSDCRNILIIAEAHTRNTWYLENIRILQRIIERAGFRSKIATFLQVHPPFCENADYVALETATGQPVRIHCFRRLLDRIKQGQAHFDLVIMNNDLTAGIPDILKEMDIPIYPSLHAGWHSRQKAHHFRHTDDLISEFSGLCGIDPWCFSAYYSVVEGVNVMEAGSLERLKSAADDLFAKIKSKYARHQIPEKPYIVIKSDSGTYGMGVKVFEEADDILRMNRRDKNRLHKGKGAQVINRFLLQEGIPTIYNIGRKVSEVVIYQVNNNLVGGFYRSHSQKNSRENLNSRGMDFQKMCPHLSKYGDCGVHHDVNIFDVYRILARIAGIAAHREISHLETIAA